MAESYNDTDDISILFNDIAIELGIDPNLIAPAQNLLKQSVITQKIGGLRTLSKDAWLRKGLEEALYDKIMANLKGRAIITEARTSIDARLFKAYRRARLNNTLCHSKMTIIMDGKKYRFFIKNLITKSKNNTLIYTIVLKNIYVLSVLKLMRVIDDTSEIAHEANILKLLQGCSGVPNLICYGNDKYKMYNGLVTQPFGIPLTYQMQQKGCLELEQCKDLSSKMIEILKQVHSRSVVHRDIKPDNIIIANDEYFLIDYGLSYHSKDSNEWKEKICGTAPFLSCKSHQGFIQTAEDDLESLLYTIVYANCGSLPWSDMSPSEPLYNSRVLYFKLNFINSNQELVNKIKSYTIDDTFIHSLDTCTNYLQKKTE